MSVQALILVAVLQAHACWTGCEMNEVTSLKKQEAFPGELSFPVSEEGLLTHIFP